MPESELDAPAEVACGGPVGGVIGCWAGSTSVVVNQAAGLASAGRKAQSLLTALGRLGCRRRAALVGKEVGALERPTSKQEGSGGRIRSAGLGPWVGGIVGLAHLRLCGRSLFRIACRRSAGSRLVAEVSSTD